MDRLVFIPERDYLAQKEGACGSKHRLIHFNPCEEFKLGLIKLLTRSSLSCRICQGYIPG
jgi:hypothetical protein